MRIYLAGSITNDPDYRIKFANAATKWRDQGWEVVNPSELNDSIHPDDNDRSRAMRIDIPLLMTCDAVYMIDGWESARCARCEWSIAECLDMQIMYDTVPMAA